MCVTDKNIPNVFIEMFTIDVNDFFFFIYRGT